MKTDSNDAVCSPIRTLDDLISQSGLVTNKCVHSLPLCQRTMSPKEKILLCHDMRGGYLEDRHNQGCHPSEIAYRFFRWHLIDIFVYFAHELVSIPPPVWIDAAHVNGVQILGTFITEFDAGKEICQQLLISDEFIDQVIDALVAIMLTYKFDGYLLNIENPIETELITRLISFVNKLKLACQKNHPTSVILWYDSVTINGDLKWQNQLNELNCPFFDSCDGIFLNYTWKPELLVQSKINAGQRDRDIFVGIDVFGRGCLGGGGFNTCEAMAISHNLQLSTALFAPGWLFETLNPTEFLMNDRKFWTLLEPYSKLRVLKLDRFRTYFSDGFGEKFYADGQILCENRWYHLGLQTHLPNSSANNDWTINHQDGYFGGSCLQIPSDSDEPFHLFHCLLPVKLMINITLIYKANVNVMIGLKDIHDSWIPIDQAVQTTTENHGWCRKVFRTSIKNPTSITEIILIHDKKPGENVKIGYVSIDPTDLHSVPIENQRVLVKSIEKHSDCSMILNFFDSIQRDITSLIYVFVEDSLKRRRFLGATHQSYFVLFLSQSKTDKKGDSTLLIRQYALNSCEILLEETVSIDIDMDLNISNLEICCLAYAKKVDEVKERIISNPDCVKQKDRDGRTVLHWACSSGATDIVEYLLQTCHVKPDTQDDLGWTPLMIAVSAGRLPIVQMLLETKKVDVEQSNSSGVRPLHYACSKNHYEIVELLIEHSADINAVDKYNQTPLDRCCSKGHRKIVELLLKHPKIDLSIHKECDGDHSLIDIDK